MPLCDWDGPHYCACHDKRVLAAKVVEAAKDVLAVRGTDMERSPLPAYMDRPFGVLAELIKAYEAER